MNLEEIKEWFRKCEPTEHSEATSEVIQWLIAEVERLHKDGMTIYGMMEDGRAKAAAKRCAEIAGQTSKVAAHRIKIEFDLLPESNTPIKFKGNI